MNEPQITELHRLEAKVDALTASVAELLAAQRRTSSFFAEMSPIATQALGVAAQHLAEIERRGYFDFAREAANVIDNIMTGYSPEDVHALADQVVRIVALFRRLTQPEVLQVAEQAADAAGQAGEAGPPGVLGILKATSRDEDVRRGLMIAVAALRQVGLAAHQSAEPGTAAPKLSPLLSNKRNLSPTPPSDSAVPAPPQVASPRIPPVDRGQSGGDVSEPAEQWTPDWAQQRAEQLGVAPLTDRHFKVLAFARSEYEQTGASPNIRRLTVGSGVPTKELYALFPRAPAKTAAKIAGIPKPVGCI